MKLQCRQPDLRERPALDFAREVVDEGDARVRDLLQMALVVKRLMVHAGCSLEVAQHRDTLLYEGRRSGGYAPKPRQFEIGDFVYRFVRSPVLAWMWPPSR
ncbi:hypothetical protein CYMTET_46582 [Cymbomonas tetramitiformis]|uniref:Uncharacterized protein n=1 Tax=Cymbomonas tetramitiformis TaxID=36881 RepID=A0AAE0BX36_9CHLO|nr:hypothetical protein CYMTET_46582 [Cymbomonas tetramitiformis]